MRSKKNSSRGLIMIISTVVVSVLLISAGAAEIRSELDLNSELNNVSSEIFIKVSESVKHDASLDVPQLIIKYGYPVESHYVATSDGYILNLHRIPYGKNGPSEYRRVVFLQHGLLQSSASWLVAGVDKALAYYLADAGYDVWMGNARGNSYSRSHRELNPNKGGQFWDFSWHEIGVIDVPTMIDFILAHTNQEKLFYIGHSQGNTAFYVMCTEMPEYNNKIIAHFSLSPTVYMDHMTSPLIKLMSYIPGGKLLLRLIGRYEFLPTDGFLTNMSRAFCGLNSITKLLCANSVFTLCGFSYKQMNTTLLPIVMAHTPAGASTKQILHYVQEVKSGKFRQYDYGFFGNRKHYGTIFPPKYNLMKITTRVFLFYSRNDWLSHERDVQKLYKKLRNAKSKLLLLVSDKKFNHLDYVFGIDAKKLVYDKILNLMKMY